MGKWGKPDACRSLGTESKHRLAFCACCRDARGTIPAPLSSGAAGFLHSSSKVENNGQIKINEAARLDQGGWPSRRYAGPRDESHPVACRSSLGRRSPLQWPPLTLARGCAFNELVFTRGRRLSLVCVRGAQHSTHQERRIRSARRTLIESATV